MILAVDLEGSANASFSTGFGGGDNKDLVLIYQQHLMNLE